MRPGYTAEDRAPPRARRLSGDSACAGGSVSAVPAVSGSVSQAAASPQQQGQLRQARARDGPERVQIAHLRQEVAQLRRQNAELSEQVRARDMQVDNLTGMVREMQATTQRQLGQWRRQLNIRDDTLHAMQEELLLTRGGCTPGGPSGEAGGANRGSSGASCSSRRVPNEPAQPTTPATRGIGASFQAPRAARRPAEGGAGERGSSATRSSSAFSRQKDLAVARRTSAASQAPGISTGQSIRAFSPRSSHPQQHGGKAVSQTGAQATVQAVPSQGSETELLRRVPVASTPQGAGASTGSPIALARALGGTAQASRSSSVDVRAQTRIMALRRAHRRQ